MDNMNRGNMAERYCALGLGILFLLVGIAGFIPPLVSLPGGTGANVPVDVSSDIYASGFGYVFGLFPTNLLHNFVHCIVGLLGIVSSTRPDNARIFNRGFAIAYVLIAIMGLLPLANTTFGLMPIFGNNVWFNALTAAVAAYFGFVQPAQATDVTASPRV